MLLLIMWFMYLFAKFMIMVGVVIYERHVIIAKFTPSKHKVRNILPNQLKIALKLINTATKNSCNH